MKKRTHHKKTSSGKARKRTGKTVHRTTRRRTTRHKTTKSTKAKTATRKIKSLAKSLLEQARKLS